MTQNIKNNHMSKRKYTIHLALPIGGEFGNSRTIEADYFYHSSIFQDGFSEFKIGDGPYIYIFKNNVVSVAVNEEAAKQEEPKKEETPKVEIKATLTNQELDWQKMGESDVDVKCKPEGLSALDKAELRLKALQLAWSLPHAPLPQAELAESFYQFLTKDVKGS